MCLKHVNIHKLTYLWRTYSCSYILKYLSCQPFAQTRYVVYTLHSSVSAALSMPCDDPNFQGLFAFDVPLTFQLSISDAT